MFPFDIVDCTHRIDGHMPFWDSKDGCVLERQVHAGLPTWTCDWCSFPAGVGTHIDSPRHCIVDGMTVDQIPIEQLIRPSVVIDVSDRAKASYRVTVGDIVDWESRYGLIPAGVCVFIRTGWDRFWSDPEAYRHGGYAPSISSDAASMLLTRGLSGVGIDTLSVDAIDSAFQAHRRFLSAGIYIIENVAHLDRLPAVGWYASIAPMKMATSEAPVRLLGLIPTSFEA